MARVVKKKFIQSRRGRNTARSSGGRRSKDKKGAGRPVFVYFDTEDSSQEAVAAGDGFKKKVTSIAAVDTDGNWFFNRGDVPEFLEWLDEGDEIIVYAHNVQYDLGNLFGDALDDFEVKAMVGSRLIQARRKGKNFRDSFNIWPMPLAKIGEVFGIDKLKMDVNDPEYVKTDVKIGAAAMNFAWDMAIRFGLKELPSTLGGFAVKVFGAMGLTNWRNTSGFAHEALYGGRVELFCTGGHGCVVHVDINSLYPWCMTLPFPRTFDALETYEKGWGIAEVSIDVPAMAIAILPFRNEAGEILYPTGKLRGIWTFHEIRAAVERGAKVTKIHHCRGSLKGYCFYKDYVDRIYALRVAAESEAEKLLFKLLLNNLYGQLANRGVVSRSFDRWESKRAGVCYGSKLFCDVSIPPPDFANYVHGAYVTAYGRLRLVEFLETIGADRLIYCDTDSAMFFWGETEAWPFPLSGSILGDMKLEKVYKWFFPYGPKMYASDPIYHPGVLAELKKQGVKLPKEPDYACAADAVEYFKRAVEIGHQALAKEKKDLKRKKALEVALDKVGKRIFLAKGVPKRLAEPFLTQGLAEYEQPYKLREAIRFYEDEDGVVVNKRKLSVWRKVVKQNRKKYQKKTLTAGTIFTPPRFTERETTARRDVGEAFGPKDPLTGK